MSPVFEDDHDLHGSSPPDVERELPPEVVGPSPQDSVKEHLDELDPKIDPVEVHAFHRQRPSPCAGSDVACCLISSALNPSNLRSISPITTTMHNSFWPPRGRFLLGLPAPALQRRHGEPALRATMHILLGSQLEKGCDHRSQKRSTVTLIS